MFQNSSGKALVELAILIPFLLLTSLVALEIYRNFQNHQFMSVVSRELGNAAFRACTEYADGANTNACLNTTMTNVFGSAIDPSSPLAAAKVRVAVYRYHSPGTAKLGGEFTNVAGETWANTHFNPTGVANLNCYMPEKTSIVTAEIFLHIDPFVPCIPGLPCFSGDYYEATIF